MPTVTRTFLPSHKIQLLRIFHIAQKMQSRAATTIRNFFIGLLFELLFYAWLKYHKTSLEDVCSVHVGTISRLEQNNVNKKRFSWASYTQKKKKGKRVFALKWWRKICASLIRFSLQSRERQSKKVYERFYFMLFWRIHDVYLPQCCRVESRFKCQGKTLFRFQNLQQSLCRSKERWICFREG